MDDKLVDEKGRFPSGHETRAASTLTRRISASPALHVFFIYILLLAGAIWYGATHFYRDPGSAFFDPSRANERYYSTLRQSEAETFILASETNRTLVNSARKPTVASKTPQICAAVITTQRNVPQHYVYNSVGSLLADLTTPERSSLYLSILYATDNPDAHPAYDQTWFNALADESYSYHDVLSQADRAHLHDLEVHGEFDEKGVFDYTLALQRCLDQTSAPLIAIFEDDVLVAQGWVARVLTEFREAQRLVIQHSPENLQEVLDEGRPAMANNGTTGCIYLRLFNQERSTGWASLKIGENNELPISLSVSSALFLALWLLRRRTHSLRNNLTPAAMGVICLLAVPSFVVLFFQSGKASLLPPSPGVHEEDFGCCSQALVFNRLCVSDLIGYLRQERTGRCDMMTRDFAHERGWKRLSLYPMSVQHVGMWPCLFTCIQNDSVYRRANLKHL